MDISDPEKLEKYRSYLRVLADMHLGPRLRTKECASDVVQVTLMNAHAAAGDFRGTTEAELKGWLRSILCNRLVNLGKKYRALKRDISRERSMDQELQNSAMRLVDDLSAGTTSPSAHLMKQEQAERLAEALTHLLEDEYQAVTLKHIHGWKVAEIAEFLGRSEVGIAGLLQRGLKKLRNQMKIVDA